MRLETADKEIEVLEKLNTRLVSQKHDMEKLNVILKYHLLRLKVNTQYNCDNIILY